MTARFLFLPGLMAVVVPVAVTAVAGASCSAFNDLPEAQPCREIPEGGCPGGDMTFCKDRSCSAIYECLPDSGWSQVAQCPVQEGGLSDVRISRPDANLLRDSHWDIPEGAWGGPGCVDLGPCTGDCSLGLALACPANQCCQCSNILVCVDGGWNDWGSCEEGGALVETPPFMPDK